MTKTPLQRAQKGLRISDVYMRRSVLTVSDAYEHRSDDMEGLQAQFRHFVEKSEVLEEQNGNQPPHKFFRVHLDLGYRWGLDGAKSPEVNESDDGFEELGRIEAKYVAEYEITDELPQECLDAFALNNASYHVWPYWREYVSNSCARMNVPKLVMPTMQPAQNREAKKPSSGD